MTEWVAQASDFITQNWAALLGILGGAGGVVSIVTLIGKIILVCIQGRMTRKNGTPLQNSFVELRMQMLDLIENYKTLVANEVIKLKEEVIEILQKYNKMKVELYDRLVNEGETAQQLLKELAEPVKQIEAVIAEQEETGSETVEEIMPNSSSPSPATELKKTEKIVIER